MPRVSHLSKEEKRRTLLWKAESMSPVDIAKNLGRSRKTIQAFLKNPERSGTVKRPGRPPSVSQTDKRIIKREAPKSNKSARDLLNDLSLSIAIRRTQQILQEEPTLQYKKMRESPRMTEKQMIAGVEWATLHLTWTLVPCAEVIFSDEKKFNLDGPDEWCSGTHTKADDSQQNKRLVLY